MSNYILSNYNRIDLEFINGKGSWLYTKDDKYLDFSSGIAVNCLGHANQKLINLANSSRQALAYLKSFKNFRAGRIGKEIMRLFICR